MYVELDECMRKLLGACMRILGASPWSNWVQSMRLLGASIWRLLGVGMRMLGASLWNDWVQSMLLLGACMRKLLCASVQVYEGIGCMPDSW